MPNIFKRFMEPKAVPYQLPNALDLEVTEEDDFIPLGEEGFPAAGEESLEQLEEENEAEAPPASEEEEPEAAEENPVQYAQVQADMILEDARRQAEQLLEEARAQAEEQIAQAKEAARAEGRQEGYAQGLTQAMEEGARAREEQAVVLQEQVAQFLEKAGAELDRQMDQSVGDLRDLALAVAEKVVSVSLKSSGDVIGRMIQAAIDKKKRREWVHIYIAECDAKRLTQAPAPLMTALTALSDRVRVIPMAGDESGTCIVEMPDEIIDASAATQLSNIRTLLMDAASGRNGGLF